MSQLREKYQKELVPGLQKDLGLRNVMQVPCLDKVVLNMSISEAVKNPKVLETAVEELTAISGQKAVITRAKKPISNFKLRKGTPLGARVTLRRERMWTFMERFINFSSPRIRDFRGLSPKGFDGRGNYSVGMKEQIVFPEINYDKVDKIRGLNISVCTTAEDDAQGRALLEALGMPFRKK